MRTYTHGVIGYLLYAKRPRHEQRLAVIGGILPDVLLALGFVAHYGAIVTQSPLIEALHTLLHHSTLHTVTIAMHSWKRNKKVAGHSCPCTPMCAGREQRRGGAVGHVWSLRGAEQGVARCGGDVAGHGR